MLNLLNKIGYAEIQGGVYLNTKEHLIEQQEFWAETDGFKTFDFTYYDYWITNDTGADPEGVDTIEEGLLIIIGIETCRKFLGE